ncbi:hypothetical protein [Cellulosimicrobium sp. E-16]|uniref:hypothetical protein n=1 Tax=Cellulosimicrobium sp. E-16 TaxID=3404049 RepID=UPI003CF91489
MTGLDPTTVLVVSPVVIVVVGSLFVLEMWRRDRTDVVDRCWTLTFVAAVVTTFAYLAASSPALWWAVPLGNAAFVVSLGSIWSGARARLGHDPALGVVGASAALVALAAIVAGPDAGPWAGALAYLVGVAAWSVLAAVALLGPGSAGAREARALGAACAVAGSYYAVRAVVYAVGGPTSEPFVRWFGTATTTLVNLVLIVVGAFAMIALRTRETAELGDALFDPSSGARTRAGLERAVAERAAEHGGAGRWELVVVALELRDVRALRDAYGPPGPERARRHLADVALETAPVGALVATDGRAPGVVVVLAEDDEVVRGLWLRALRGRLVDRPFALGGEVLGLDVGEGVASGAAAELWATVERARTTARGSRDRAAQHGDDVARGS